MGATTIAENSPGAAGSNTIPRRYVPGRGRTPARLMFVGEAPGRNENSQGLPFVGQAGWELDRYAASAGIDLSSCYITNLYKFWPLQDFRGKQLPPSPEQIASGELELLLELSIVRPEVIVTLGAYAARWFLGAAFKSMRRDWGVPRPWRCRRQQHQSIGGEPVACVSWVEERDGPAPCSAIVFPIGHPAAGLHNDREQVQIQEGFLRLGRMLRGQLPRVPPANKHPEVRYSRLTDDDVGHLRDVLAGHTVIAIDTEGGLADPWCLTFAVRPGEAFLVRSTERECLAALNAHINAPGGICTVICHNLAYDLPVLDRMGVRISKHRALNPDGSLTLRCTMSEAFLTGTEPKGLKDLSWRLSGGEMRSYEELVGPTEREISRAWIEQVSQTFRCSACGGAGKLPKYGKGWAAVPDCVRCSGSGLDPLGKSGKPLKKPRRCECCAPVERLLQSTDRCEQCVDGLLIPRPEREYVFDGEKFRWKQPQSLGRWIARRIGNGGVGEEEPEEDGLSGAAAEAEQEGQEDEQEEDERVGGAFKLRKDWMGLSDRSDWRYVEAILGRMPRTTLTEVEQREGEWAVTAYACNDASFTLRNAPKLEEMLSRLHLLPVREQDAAFIPMLSRMEQVGMRIDRPHFQRFDAYLDERLDEIRGELSELVGRQMNPNSPKMADLLFRDLGLPIIKFTKSGERESVDDDVLGTLKAKIRKRLDANPDDQMAALQMRVCSIISDYREHRKLKDYTRPILQFSDANDRIHTTLNYTGPATGRLSSSDPINLQTLPNPDNYPKELEKDWERNYGLRTRGGFVAKPGYALGEADYSSIEMVVAAHLTQDAGLLKVFREGLDPHKYAASLMFDLPYDQIPKMIRTQVKPVNFGSLYGIGPEKLQMQLATLPSGAIEKTLNECAILLALYYEKFPGVLEWKERLWAEATRTGYVSDLFGRIRWVPGLRSRIRKVRSAAEREAANMPIQSTANGIIRVASRSIWERDLPMMWDAGVDVEVIMQTHDANTVEAPKEHIGWVMAILAETMRTAVTLSVPIKVGVAIGDSLAQCK